MRQHVETHLAPKSSSYETLASIFMNTSLFETHNNDRAVMQPPTAKVVLLMFIAEHSFLVLKVACFLPRPHPSPN